MLRIHKKLFLFLVCTGCAFFSSGQLRHFNKRFIVGAAGPEYQRSPFYQSLWGHNYRKEWSTSLSFPVLILDTAYGGLIPYKEGGGHQSKSLRLKTKEGKEYAMRSVNKTLKVLIPPIFYKTFVEHLVNDEISMSHPYAALTVPPLAEAAHIYHTYPKYVYLPRQPLLDSFNKEYADRLYLLEQRAEGDWSNADNLGNFTDFISSEKLRENIFEDNTIEIDQLAFAKARIFDMFLGDWDRHEDQWKWGLAKKENKTMYVPVPVDRDQVYSKFDGLLLKAALSAGGAKYFQSFDYDIPYPEGFSYERRNVDRFFTNRLTLTDWQALAKELEGELTDEVIERSIKKLPPEIYAVSGDETVAKLKSRRQYLEKYARKYYLFITKTVDIVGSAKREYFEVNRTNDQETEVNIFDFEKGQRLARPYYSRKFLSKETDEIRLYGLSGKDVYAVNGSVSKGVRIRIIGGNDKDSVAVNGGGKKVHFYDDHGENTFEPHSKIRKHLSSDSTVHDFDYDAFRAEKKGLKPALGYNDEDRLYVGLAYGWQHQSFRKDPFAFKQNLSVNYSISQTALSAVYTGVFPGAVAGCNLLLDGSYDAVRWTNFLGLGNETSYSSKPINFFRLRTAEWLGRIGLNKLVGISNITVSGFFNSVKILLDSNKFITHGYLPAHPESFRVNSFAGGALNYNITSVNDSVVPVKGVILNLNAGYTENLNDTKRSFANFGGEVQFFVPLIPKISLAIIGGGATVTGTPEFYQYPVIGGASTLRGYIRERFRGKTTFYNSNELRFLTNIRSYFMNGKVGLVAFFDNGRVWMPGENSSAWHTGYGGGILIAPFNLMFFDITYGVSSETSQIQTRLRIKL